MSKRHIGFISVISLLGLLAVGSMPGTALATATSIGSASIDSLTFTFGGNTVDASTFFNTYKSSFSGSQVGLNGVQTDVGDSDYTDGTFGNTSFTASLSDGSGSVTGTADTTAVSGAPTSQSASMAINLNGFGTSFVDPITPNQAQSDTFGTITAATSGTLIITAGYSLTQSLISDTPGGYAFSDVAASLDLYEYDSLGFPLNDPSAFDLQELSHSVAGISTWTDGLSGTLSLTYDLAAGSNYDIDILTTANGAASVPEPGTFMLLGLGLLVFGIPRVKDQIASLIF